MRIPLKKAKSTTHPASADLDKPSAEEIKKTKMDKKKLEDQIDAAAVAAKKAYKNKKRTDILNTFVKFLELYEEYMTPKMDKLGVYRNLIVSFKYQLLDSMSALLKSLESSKENKQSQFKCLDDYQKIEANVYDFIENESGTYKMLTPEIIREASANADILGLNATKAARYFQSLAPKKLAHVPWMVSFHGDFCIYAKTGKKVSVSDKFPVEKLDRLFNEYKAILSKQGFDAKVEVESSPEKVLYGILIPELDKDRLITILKDFETIKLVESTEPELKGVYSERVTNLIKIGTDLFPKAKRGIKSFGDNKFLTIPPEIRNEHTHQEELDNEKSIFLDKIPKFQMYSKKIEKLASSHHFKIKWSKLFFNNEKILYNAAASIHTKYLEQVGAMFFTVIEMVKAEIFPKIISRFELFGIQFTTKFDSKTKLGVWEGCAIENGIVEAILVFDRDPKTDPTDMLTWNKEAVILNPNINKCLPIQEYTKDPQVLSYRRICGFPKKMKVGDKEFFTFDVSNLNKAVVEQIENDLATVLNWLDPKAYPLKSKQTSPLLGSSTLAGAGLATSKKKKRKKKAEQSTATAEPKGPQSG